MASILMTTVSKKPTGVVPNMLKKKFRLLKNLNPKRSSVSLVPKCSFPLGVNIKNKKLGSQTRDAFVSSGADLSSLHLGLDVFGSAMEDELYEEEEEQVMMRRWTLKELKEGIELKVNMPGLGKDDVKVTVEDTSLVICTTLVGKEEEENEKSGHVEDVNGVTDTNPESAEHESDDDESEYDSDDEDVMNTMIIFDLDLDLLNLQALKAEMKNGLLKIFIPKVKVEKKAIQVVVE